MKVSEEPIVVEQAYRASIDELWKSITDPDRMREWYFEDIPEFRARPGFTVRFSVRSGGKDFLHLWEVIEAKPGESLSYRWRFDGIPGDSVVEFALSGGDDSSRLRLTCRVTEDFPDDIPEFRRESCLAGWRFFLQERLKGHLEGR